MGFSFWWLLLLWSTGLRALVVATGFMSPQHVEYHQISDIYPLHWLADSYPHCTTGKSSLFFFLRKLCLLKYDCNIEKMADELDCKILILYTFHVLLLKNNLLG